MDEPQTNAIDIVKAVCVSVMVFTHCQIWLLSFQDISLLQDDYLFVMVSQLKLLGIFPLSIPAAAGTTLRVQLDPYFSGQRTPLYPIKAMVTVAIVLVILSVITNFLTWGLDVRVDWDVLQFIAVSFLVVVIVMKYLGTFALAALGLATLAATPILIELLQTQNSFLTSVLVGREADQVGFYWPIFPWFSTVIFGFYLEHFRRKLQKTANFDLILLISAGLVAAGTLFWDPNLFAIDASNVWGANIFQPGIAGILLVGSGYSALYAFANLIAPRIKFRKFGFISCFSAGILWIYLTHQILGVNLAYLFKEFRPLWLITPLFTIIVGAFSWIVGALTIIIAAKRIRITLQKVS